MKLFRLHGTFIASYDKRSQWDENYIILNDDQHSVSQLHVLDYL